MLFAALGDQTRLALLETLAMGEPRSISQLKRGSRISRQAVTKHLRVLERAGVVHSVRAGRENRFALDPEPLAEMHEYLDRIAQHWDRALGRLKALVEEEGK